MKKILAASLMLLAGNIVSAQQEEFYEKPEMYKGRQVQTVDTTSLLSAFKRGHYNGHFRYFFMTTDNTAGLADYYANAVGAGIRYETAKFHGFQFAVNVVFIFNIGSSDFTKADSITGQYNRYEIALFDLENPSNKKDLGRLEEIYVKYNFKKSTITLGRQLINTPFINLQDSRMRPTGVEGIWFELNQIKRTKIEAGWLYSISPRSTTGWYNAGTSIGIYSAGVNVDGTKSQYKNNIQSKAVALLGISTAISKTLKLQVWNILAENVFNGVIFQSDVQFPLKNNSTIIAAAQGIRLDALKYGGNKEVEKTYFEKGGRAMSFGARVGWKNKLWEASINYNRITTDGRYLMPREWGREPFFTFLPRERNEGLGDVHAFMSKLNYNSLNVRIKASVAAGYYKLPDVKNYRLNKYGLPSYTQVNADVRYSFAGMMKGFEAQVLIVGKKNIGEIYNNKRFEFNKVNMIQYNFVLNYHF